MGAEREIEMNSNVKLALVFLGMALILIGAFFIVRQKNMIPENPEDTVVPGVL